MEHDTPNATPNHHLGIRLAVGVVGVLLLLMFAMLAQVAMKQSATQQALESPQAQQQAESNPATPQE